MTTLDTNLNYVSTLADQPAISTQELKQTFDMAGNTIKTWINEVHIPEIEAGFTSTLNSAKSYTDTQITSVSGDVTALANIVNALPTSEQITALINSTVASAVSSAVPDMTTKYATGITYSSGVTQIFNQVFKINKLVHVYLEDNFTISRISSGSQLCVLPSGYRPANAVKCMVLCTNEAHTFHVTATINTNGAVIIPRSRKSRR